MTLRRSLCLFFVITFPITLSHLDEKYQTCIEPSQCGTIQNISYPFWGLDKPEYCGYPGLKLICNSDSNRDGITDDYLGPGKSFPLITIMDTNYRVLHINGESKTLTVARQDYMQVVCPTSITWNATVNFTLFDFSSDTQNISLYYGCPEARGEILGTLLPNQFNCSLNNEAITYNYYFLGNASSVKGRLSAISTYLESCDRNVIIPVWESKALAIAKSPDRITLLEALRSGFGLQWNANNRQCDECVSSKGVCGYDDSTRQFTCYCPHQPFSFTCLPVTTTTGMSNSYFSGCF